jgi:hypothetical protein
VLVVGVLIARDADALLSSLAMTLSRPFWVFSEE